MQVSPHRLLVVSPVTSFSLYRHPYIRFLTLSNASKLPVKYEVLPQENASKGLAIYSTQPAAGAIPALGSVQLSVTLQTARLGRLQLPMKVQVSGVLPST